MKDDQFDARTRANMEVALDRVCSPLPDGERHEVRKRIAEQIRRCAKKGRTTLKALTSAGESALPKKQPSSNGKGEMRPKHHVRAQIANKASRDETPGSRKVE